MQVADTPARVEPLLRRQERHCRSSYLKTDQWRRTSTMALWLTLIVVGVILAILGFAGIADFLIWLGVIVLVVGLISSFVTRRRP